MNRGSTFCKLSSEAKGKWLSLLSALAICLLPRLIFSFLITPFEYSTDEFSTLSAVSLIYPADWSEVLSACCGYYGGGFSILLFPLFYLIKDPIIIYRIMLIIMCLLQALVAIPAFITADRHFGIKDGTTLFLFSTAASYLVTRRSNNITNEHILYLLTWLIVLVLLELVESEAGNKKTIALSILLGLLMAYAVAVHERGFVFFCAFAVSFLFYLIVFRKQVVSLAFFLPVYAAGYFCSRLLKKAIIGHNFIYVDRLANTSIGFSNVRMLFNPANLKPYLMSLAGSLTTSSLITCGLMMSALIIGFWLIFSCLMGIEPQRTEEDRQVVLKKFSFCFIFLVSGLVAVLLWQPLGWMPGLEAAVSEGVGSINYSLKMLTYIRYYGNFISPAVMLSVLWYLFDNEKGIRKYLISLLFLLGLCMIWRMIILPHVAFSEDSWETWMPFGGKDLFSFKHGYAFYRYGVIVLAACAVLFYLFVKKRWFKTLLFVLCAFTIFEYGYLSIHFDLYLSQKRSAYVEAWKILKNTGVDKEINELYVNGNFIAPTIQFLFYDKTVHMGLPDLKNGEGLVISNELAAFKDSFKYGWMMVDHEDITVNIFVKGEHLVRVLEEGGVSCVAEVIFPNGRHPKELNPKEFISGENLDLYLSDAKLETDVTSEDSDEISEVDNEKAVREKDYKDIVIKETDTWKALSLHSTTLQGGTYRFQLALDEKVSKPPKVQLISMDGNFILNNSMYSEDGQVWETLLSVWSEKKVIVLVSSDEYEPRIALASFEQLSAKFSVGLDSERDIDAIVEKINEDLLYDEIVFLCNRTEDYFDLQYLSERLPDLTVSAGDEFAVSEKKKTYALVKKEQAWLRLAEWFDPVLVTDNYVLLASSEDADGFVPIGLLQNGEGGYCSLPYGDYRIRLEKFFEYLSRYEGDVTFTICSTDEINEYYEGIVKKNGKYGSISFRNLLEIENWKLILRHGDETINIGEKDISIRQTRTRNKIIYDGTIRKMIKLLNSYPGEGHLTIYADFGGQTKDLVRQFATADLDSGWSLETAEETALDIENLSPDDNQAYIIPFKTRHIFDSVPDFVIAGRSSVYLLLLPNTKTVIDNLKKAKIERFSEGSAIAGKVFYTSSDGQTFSLEKGTYRFCCVPQEGDVDLYLPLKPNRIKDPTNPGMALLCEPPVHNDEFYYTSLGFTSGLKIRNEVGEPVWIKQIQKISDDYTADLTYSAISGTYDPQKRAVTGTGEIRIETEPFPIKKNTHYLVKAEFEGVPQDVLLEVVNNQFSNEIIHARSDIFVQQEDGSYTCDLVYHSKRQNGKNLIRFYAGFTGSGAVRQITIRSMSDTEYQQSELYEYNKGKDDQ